MDPFTYDGIGPSAAQSIVVGGTNLVGNLVITLDGNYEISTDDFSPDPKNTLSVGSGTTVYVRLKDGVEVSESSPGTLTITNNGVNKVITLTGSVTAA